MRKIYRFLLILIFFVLVLLLNNNSCLAVEYSGNTYPDINANYCIYFYDDTSGFSAWVSESPMYVDTSYNPPRLCQTNLAYFYYWSNNSWVNQYQSWGWSYLSTVLQPFIYSSYDVLDQNGDVFFTISFNNNNNISENFSKFALPSRDVLYDYIYIETNTSLCEVSPNTYDYLTSYTLYTSPNPITISEPACSSCQNNHSNYCSATFEDGSNRSITYCVNITGKFKCFDFLPNSAENLYALHNQHDDKNYFNFNGFTYYNGWRYVYTEDNGNLGHFHNHNNTTLLYYSHDNSLNDFDNVKNHFATNFNQSDLDFQLLDIIIQVGTNNHYIADNTKISTRYDYEMIYKADNKYFYISTKQPIFINPNGCEDCNYECTHKQSYLDMETICPYSGEVITYCIDVQNGDDIIYCLYDPTMFPQVNNYTSFGINTDLWSLVFKTENIQNFNLHYHEVDNFSIIYSNYNITDNDGNIVFNQVDLMEYRKDVVNNFSDYTFYANYDKHFADLEEHEDNLLVRILKAVFIPSQERTDGIVNAVKDKFRFIDSITGGIDELKTIFSNLEGAPTLTLYGVNTKYFNGNLTYFDLSWYEPFKPYGDLIITGFIYIFYLLRLFAHIPNIIHGIADYGEVRSDNNRLIRSEREGTVYYFRKKLK